MPFDKPPYSIERIRDFLVARYGNEVRNIQPLKGGDWSSAYAFQRKSHHYVLRLGDDDYTFRKDQVAAGFASTYLPIPKVEAIGKAFGGFYAI